MSRHTPLYEVYASRCRLAEFAGWALPLQFSGLTQEHQAVRQGAGLFDISHMGQLWLRGSAALSALNRLVPTDVTHLEPGQALYTLLLNEAGGILDDVVVYVQADAVLLIVNGATVDTDRAWLATHLPPAVTVEQAEGQVLMALQGPKAVALLQGFCDLSLADLGRFSHQSVTLLGRPAWVARTGYTGEDGVEILTTPELGRDLWRTLLDAGVAPCGLGARDTLRLEAGLHLYGQDMTAATTPLEACLAWLVDWHKGDFLGRPALERQRQQGVAQKLVGLTLSDRHIARSGYPILEAGRVVGRVTSGTFAPSLGRPIALGYVPTSLA
ncbi:MAG: glycine cleavage system aminomethyltransferase GcvT, partial [Gloeomargaritaceae cyanobacterium C42_A2020_066]|nr:glycine cleavage system aminomethyltransferase GcvT [Gloeomargaritaceae cyanobacterium C42_A2020_066]